MATALFFGAPRENEVVRRLVDEDAQRVRNHGADAGRKDQGEPEGPASERERDRALRDDEPDRPQTGGRVVTEELTHLGMRAEDVAATIFVPRHRVGSGGNDRSLPLMLRRRSTGHESRAWWRGRWET